MSDGSRRPTIADVARVAGVSKGLVSFVYNDRPGVAPQTRERIVAAAAELGWRPNVRARSLSTRTSFALGLVLRRASTVIAADPFFTAFIAGVEAVSAGDGRVLVLSLVADEEAELSTYRRLVEDSRVDGVFLTDLRRGDPRLALVDELGLPAVAIGRPEEPTSRPVVNLDDTPGVRAVVDHLVGLGHTRIAHVAGDPAMVHGFRRARSFVDTLADHGLTPRAVVETDFSVPAGARATAQLMALPDPPTAIVYASDPMAIAGLGLLHEQGHRVPDDVSVTGFDGTEMARHVYPSLTTVASDPVAWGSAAATVLLELIAHGAAADVELAPAELRLGASTASPQTPVLHNPSSPTPRTDPPAQGDRP